MLNSMMTLNVKDYLKVYDDFLDTKTCKAVAKKLKKADWQLHTFYQPQSGSFVSYDKELSITYAVEIEETKEIQTKIWFAIEQYINKDHAHMADWFSGWNGYSQLRYNRYNTDTQMKLHCDHIHSMFDGNRKGIPTLSILGSLNDDYEGGEFVMWRDKVIELKAGSILIFPSVFLFPHRVDPIKKGTRHSFVSWAY